MINGISNAYGFSDTMIHNLDQLKVGGNPLTDQEKEDLSSKYDVKNMTGDQELQLEGDLSHDGVISVDQFVDSLFRMRAEQDHNKINLSQKQNWISYYKNAQNSTVAGNDSSFDSLMSSVLSELA